MWFDCGNVFINLNHVDYVSFEETEETCKAVVFFESNDSLTFEHSDIKILKSHFRKIFEVENGINHRKTEEMG